MFPDIWKLHNVSLEVSKQNLDNLRFILKLHWDIWALVFHRNFENNIFTGKLTCLNSKSQVEGTTQAIKTEWESVHCGTRAYRANGTAGGHNDFDKAIQHQHNERDQSMYL